MLPRDLSEGLISLNPGVVRRALVFRMVLDEAANLVRTEVVRARIKSRHKLAWGDVQRLYDDPQSSPLSRGPVRESLLLLREVGEKRIVIADAHDVVRYRRREVEVKVAGDEMGFVVLEAVRDRVELYNEQISILCNREAGRLLADHPAPYLQPIYRVHPAPEAADVEIELWSTGEPGYVDPASPAVVTALDAFEHTLGVRPAVVRTGGSIPVVAALTARGLPTIVTGFIRPTAQLHSPNENLPAPALDEGLATIVELLRRFGTLG